MHIALVLSFVFCCSDITPQKAKYYKKTITIKNIEREYYIYIPPSAASSKNSPVVFAFHGYKSDANGLRWLIQPDKTADNFGYIMVYPNAIDKSWNAGKGFGSGNKSIDDLSFISTLIDTVTTQLPVDTSRIYAMGFSNGAQMVNKILNHYPQKITAAAIIAHTFNENISGNKHNMPVVIIHGTEDKMAPFNGGGKYQLRSHLETVKYFKKLNSTSDSGKTLIDLPTVKAVQYSNKSDMIVVDVTCYGNGHTWPGGREFMIEQLGTVNKEFDANSFIFDFFNKYTGKGLSKKRAAPSSKQPEKIRQVTPSTETIEPDIAPPSTRQKQNPIIEGILNSFSLPIDDLLKKKNDSEWDNLTDGLSLALSFSLPLKEKDTTKNNRGLESQGEEQTNMAFLFNLRYTPISYWFINMTFYKYVNADLQEPWNPDFTYSFGYDDWHPYTLSLVYSNYGGNRLNPDKTLNENFTRFEEGTITLGWKFPSPKLIEDIFLGYGEGKLSHRINFSLTPKYRDLASISVKEWKKVLSLSTNYTIYSYFYFTFSVFYYLDSSSKQPWNPDFTYGFGYSDWHPGTISLRYSNYAGNRFPWNKSSNSGRFIDGSISVSWSYSF